MAPVAPGTPVTVRVLEPPVPRLLPPSGGAGPVHLPGEAEGVQDTPDTVAGPVADLQGDRDALFTTPIHDRAPGGPTQTWDVFPRTNP